LPIHGGRSGGTDGGGRDVVEERGHHEHHRQQHQPARPVVRQDAWQQQRQLALLEVPREDGEPHQQREQVCEQHPLGREVSDETRRPRDAVEIGEYQLVRGDRQQAEQRDREGVPVKDRDPEQREPEEHELERKWHQAALGQCAAMTPLRTASVIAAMSGAR
jgi:hypothetical protein